MPQPPTAIYPGSFDPPTLAHVDMIVQSIQIFPKLTVIVATNPTKSTWFTTRERVSMLQELVTPASSDEIQILGAENRYVPDIARTLNAQYVVRGLRSSIDFEYETKLMRMYRMMNPHLSPVYLPSFPERDMDLISSSFVKSLVGPPGWEHIVRRYLPAQITEQFIIRANEKLEAILKAQQIEQWKQEREFERRG